MSFTISKSRIVEDIEFKDDIPSPDQSVRSDLFEDKTDFRCFKISQFLSPEECEYLISEGRRLGFSSLEQEYEHSYRSSKRVLVRCPALAVKLFDRLINHLKPEDIEASRPYGFDNIGTWKPAGLNDVFKISCYPKKTNFLPHYDGCFVLNDDCRSVFTLLIYLNDDFKGGDTAMRMRNKQYAYMTAGSEGIIAPAKGQAVIFNHDVAHAGKTVQDGFKYVMKTEVLFRRTSRPYPPLALNSYGDDPLYKQACELYTLADKLEAEGDVSGATAAYLKALDIQIQFSSYPSTNPTLQSDDPTRDMSSDTFAHVFDSMELADILAFSTVSKRWHKIVRESKIWFNRFIDDYPKLFELEKTVSNRSKSELEGKSFLKDWYQTYKQAHLLSYKSHGVVCIDLGETYTKASFRHTKVVLPTLVAQEYHSHYIIVGRGYTDIWRAGTQVFRTGIIYNTTELIKASEILDYDALWLLLDRTFTQLSNPTHDRLKVASQLPPKAHPVIVAEGSIPHDRAKLEHTMFQLLGVPSLCVVNASVLALYAAGRDTGVVVDFGATATVCTPVWQGKALTDLATVYSTGTKSVQAYFASLVDRNDEHMWQGHENYSAVLRVALEYDDELFDPRTLPRSPLIYMYNGEKTITNEHLKAAELYFNSKIGPAQYNTEPNSVVTFVFNSINVCDPGKLNTLFNNILLVGGGAAIAGLHERFEADMKILRPQCSVIDKSLTNPHTAVIEGANNFAKTSQYKSHCLSRLEYLESGPRRVQGVHEMQTLNAISKRQRKDPQ